MSTFKKVTIGTLVVVIAILLALASNRYFWRFLDRQMDCFQDAQVDFCQMLKEEHRAEYEQCSQ